MKEISIVLMGLSLVFSLSSQTYEKRCFKIMCYNVENYFDCLDDSLTSDEEYLPSGMRAWTNDKYQKNKPI